MKRADRQKIIKLRFYERQSWEAIASEVGISRPTINKDMFDNADVWFSEIRFFFVNG